MRNIADHKILADEASDALRRGSISLAGKFDNEDAGNIAADALAEANPAMADSRTPLYIIFKQGQHDAGFLVWDTGAEKHQTETLDISSPCTASQQSHLEVGSYICDAGDSDRLGPLGSIPVQAGDRGMTVVSGSACAVEELPRLPRNKCSR